MQIIEVVLFINFYSNLVQHIYHIYIYIVFLLLEALLLNYL
jgi:hypothetical protein